MKASVRALLDGIIDYAGLFPPAKLPMADALRIYLHAKKHSPYRWMLGRFVCSAVRLPELLALAKGHPDASLLTLTVLGTQAAPTPTGFFDQLDSDLQAIREFRDAWGNPAIPDAFEALLQPGFHPEKPLLDGLLERLAKMRIRPFFEALRNDAWSDEVVRLASLFSGTGVGLKIRTGGVAATAFPSVLEVARFIQACQGRVPWKATAGLHHPRPHFDQALQVWHHGFLNVFIAGLLAESNSVAEADLEAILSDRECEHFTFGEDHIAWKHWRCPLEQIVAQRSSFATTFGSCSFEEPCQDLIEMGLLDK